MADEEVSKMIGSERLDTLIEVGYSPSEPVVELAKCVLGMLHYRVLSWPHFSVLVRRRNVMVSELKRYDTELIDSDDQSQINEFKNKYNIQVNSSNIRKL